MSSGATSVYVLVRSCGTDRVKGTLQRCLLMHLHFGRKKRSYLCQGLLKMLDELSGHQYLGTGLPQDNDIPHFASLYSSPKN